MSKNFNKWTVVKQKLHNGKKENYFKERDILDDINRIKSKLRELVNV